MTHAQKFITLTYGSFTQLGIAFSLTLFLNTISIHAQTSDEPDKKLTKVELLVEAARLEREAKTKISNPKEKQELEKKAKKFKERANKIK